MSYRKNQRKTSEVPMSKVAKSISVIGGSDGPTSIFLVENKQMEKGLFQKIEKIYRIKKHQYRLSKAKKTIRPGVHTLHETICYMKEHNKFKNAEGRRAWGFLGIELLVHSNTGGIWGNSQCTYVPEE